MIILPFAEHAVSYCAIRIDKIEARPGVVRERTPNLIVVIENDRIGNAVLLQRSCDIAFDMRRRRTPIGWRAGIEYHLANC